MVTMGQMNFYTHNMEATIQHTDNNKTIMIVVIFIAVVLTLCILSSRNITQPIDIPSVEMMQWSTDTCWVGGWR